jgi:hypothetical protein
MRARAVTAVRWAWLACAAALLVHGLLATASAVRRWTPGRFTGPMASTDHMLAFLLFDTASQPLRDALRDVPDGDAVLFVGRASAPAYAQTYYGVASATLPRQVADLRCADSGEAPPHPHAALRFGAVVLFEPVRPIDEPAAVKVGDRLAVIRGQPRADVRSYCSAVVPGTDPGWTEP